MRHSQHLLDTARVPAHVERITRLLGRPVAVGHHRHRMRVAVESVEQVFTRARFGASMGTGLVRAARQTGIFVELARARGALVLEVPAARWRKGLTGRGNATDAQIKIALSGLLRGERTNAHERDALGLARHAWLWATKTPEGIEAVRCHEWAEAIGK